MIKLKTSAIITSGVLVTSLTSAYLFNGLAHGEWDFDGLNQQVQHLSEQSDNHEARITNVENKVNTPADQPTPTPVVVTQVITQQAPQTTTAPKPADSVVSAPVAAPTVAPKTVVKETHMLCQSTTQPGPWLKLIVTEYSDGTGGWVKEDGSAYTGGCVSKGAW